MDFRVCGPDQFAQGSSVSCFDLSSGYSRNGHGFASLATSTVLLETERFAKVAGLRCMSAIN
jgi:hypothetical protein